MKKKKTLNQLIKEKLELELSKAKMGVQIAKLQKQIFNLLNKQKGK